MLIHDRRLYALAEERSVKIASNGHTHPRLPASALTILAGHHGAHVAWSVEAIRDLSSLWSPSARPDEDSEANPRDT